ncbi:MAG: hypothetical protein IJT09_03500 [Abditibacteriota bacterium]|nr:hypothetical protein [Abditibacteriota bacterium]
MKTNGRLALSLGLTAVFLALVGAARPTWTMQETYYHIKKYNQRRCCDVALCGDSRIECGLVPEVMSPICGKTYNFAYGALCYSDDYYKRIPGLLDPKGKKIIVMGVQPADFDKDESDCPLINAMSPARRSFELNIVQRLEAFKLDKNKGGHHPDGYNERKTKPTEAAKATLVAGYRDNRPAPKSEIDKLASFVKEQVEDGFTVIGIRTPTTPEMVAVQDEKWDGEYAMKALKDAGMIWVEIDGNFETWDASHLTTDSAREYSEKLARKIKEIEDGRE